MNAPLPEHLAYLASAGSGKTYRLAHRVIHLLALGVEPSSICALTFSRKAAGEIFESVAGYLVAAAESDDAARRTAAEIGMPGLGRDAFRDALRAFLDGMHRSCIGTIDSFVHGVARAFACELGITPSFQSLDSASPEAEQMRVETLERILRGGEASSAEREAFVEAFREATSGRAVKGFLAQLKRLIAEWQPAYQRMPEAERWTPEAVWPGGMAIPLPDDTALDAASRVILAWAENQPDADALTAEMENLLAEVWAFEPGRKWPQSTPFKNACAVFPDLLAGCAEFNVKRKKRRIEGDLAAAWAALVCRVAARELHRRARTTGGLYQLLSRYERHYQERGRLTGQMTFDDLTRLLAPGPEGRGLTGDPGRADRLFIDYRLDARIRHWLLDEFQDTSDLQWEVLGNLVDEVMQDAEGDRRFFCVGDVKQAIYGWRGGNARIFERLLNHYGEALRLKTLPESFRSVPAVIEAVNLLFSDITFGDAIPDAVRARWSRLWETHTVAERNRGRSGCVAVVDSPLEGRLAGGEVLESVLPALREVLRELDPPSRGLSCAILLRSNDQARQVVGYLREHLPGVPVRLEGESELMDCPAVRVLLAALRAAFHPLDKMAEGIVRMSPLGSVPNHVSPLVAPGSVPNHGSHESHKSHEPPGSIPKRLSPSPKTIRADFRSRGALAALTRLHQALAEAAPPDAFTRSRLRALLDLAAGFDAAGGGTPGEFETLVREHSFGDRAAEGSVRVMTMHKSKGLGFDIVLLPGLSAAKFTPSSARSGPLIDPAHSPPRWVLDKPLGGACELDPVLSAALQAGREEDSFEEVCLFYVAVTRAKRGLYLFTASKEGKPDESHQGGFVLAKLPPAASGERAVGPGRVRRLLGEWDWYAPCVPAAAAEATLPPVLPATFLSASQPALESLAPSSATDFTQTGDRVFDPESGRVLDFGSHMHALFEAVEWLEDAQPAALLEAWRRKDRPDERMDRHITPQFLSCFDRPDFRRELARPPGDFLLWREKRFEMIFDGKWVSGTFDRVVLHRNDAGEVESATLLDYKTNRVSDPAALIEQARHYSGQMNTYRRALSGMLGLAPARIRAVLLFTVPGMAVEVAEE